VISRCTTNGLVEILSATAAQGYQVEQEDHELDDHPKVEFTSGRQKVEVRLRCVNGMPNPEVKYDN
jgi:hypothetical protein